MRPMWLASPCRDFPWQKVKEFQGTSTGAQFFQQNQRDISSKCPFQCSCYCVTGCGSVSLHSAHSTARRRRQVLPYVSLHAATCYDEMTIRLVDSCEFHQTLLEERMVSFERMKRADQEPICFRASSSIRRATTRTLAMASICSCTSQPWQAASSPAWQSGQPLQKALQRKLAAGL